MATWSDLEHELATWHAAGVMPTFWWRDDDTEAPSAALDRLLALSERHAVPLHLAVVPANVSPELADRLRAAPDVHVLQHGYAHINHEPAGARASEVGRHRDLALKCRDLRNGWQCLRDADLPNLLPGFAAPWNRISDDIVACMPGLGYRLLSTAYPRAAATPVAGLKQVNVHVDPIRWKQGARFRGTETTLENLCEHLVQRRQGTVDRSEPTGLTTHHLQTDDQVWDFVDELLDRLTRRDTADWVRLSACLESG